jgi:hypothetical protein
MVIMYYFREFPTKSTNFRKCRFYPYLLSGVASGCYLLLTANCWFWNVSEDGCCWFLVLGCQLPGVGC